MIQMMLGATAIYLLCGFLFSIPFAWIGAGRIDSHAAHSSWGFRIMVIPGAILLWPFLLRRWMAGIGSPPEEANAHRSASYRTTSP